MNEFEKNEFENNNAENNPQGGENVNIQSGSAEGSHNDKISPYAETGYRLSGESIDYSREIIDCTGPSRGEISNSRNMPYGGQGAGLNNQAYSSDNGNGFITIKNVDPEKSKKRRAKLFKGVKTAAAAIICFASAGAGIGFGINAGDSFFNRENSELSTEQRGSDFKFPEASGASDETTENADDYNIILTGTNTIAPIINKVKDSVVNISIKTQTTTFFNQVYESEGAGSGVIYDQDDEKVYIITNNHVIEGASNVQISVTGNEQVPASLVGRDASSDLALISVTKADLAKAGINEITVAEFADTDNLEVGEYVLALGNALGEGKTVTQGIISASNKEINVDGKRLTVLQTDAAINPGNSGGALIDTDGKVVGINTAKISSSSVEGIGYAIPASYVKSIISEIRVNGTVERPYLGISGYSITTEFKQMYNISADGVFLVNVEKGSAAESAGLIKSDIITGFNGQEIKSMDDLSSAISKCKVNDVVSIEYLRNGTTKMSTTATLQSYSQNF